ncbi:MAG: septum formation protein Maf, partial [Eubacterium sp.]|nr:septum formation protein Maf [Eubacterium sp.]
MKSKKQTIILASQSPRRKELLQKHGIDFSVFVTDCDETVKEPLSPKELVEELSLRKAKSAAEHFISEEVLIIAADTVVALENEIFGKPKDAEDAFLMLSQLSAKAHSVFTGVTLAKVRESEISYQSIVCETKVYFKPLTREEILEYIATKEPFDKA